MRVLDLSNARLDVFGTLSACEQKAVDLLVKEVEARTGLNWQKPPNKTSQAAIIAVHHATGAGPTEGFRLTVGDHRVEVRGNDERGTLFGIGRLLRGLYWKRGYVSIEDKLDLSSAPDYALRGHQIGYRPKVNTYDAWTPSMFEQYVRDLAVFGTNAIELVSPQSDDFDDSPQFLLPKLEMMVEMSRIIAEYGLQVWVWLPVLNKQHTDQESIESALREWKEVYSQLPRIDAIFVPGGDPGSTPAQLLMSLLEQLSGGLRKFHPEAEMWVSPQNFNRKELSDFVAILSQNPDWLNGVVYGPGVRIAIDELRAIVPGKYPIRSYPDITHSIHCQYPVPQWDTAYAVTEGREVINPRPRDFRTIFRLTSPSSIGFISYSEGVNDDVNKILWSSLGWDHDQEPIQILREYSRYFISSQYEYDLAQVLLALEHNWRGPLLGNQSVGNTLLQVKAIEQVADPQMLLKWRFQQILYRAYYDEYVRQRLSYETSLEQQALSSLRSANQSDISIAVDDAFNILSRSVTDPIATDLKSRIAALAEALYQSIRMQLSVDKYKSIAVSRGANLDSIEFPLNNRYWLRKELMQHTAKTTDREMFDNVHLVLNRTNPGAGGFYDDLGNTMVQPHLVDDGPGYAKDPGRRYSVETSFLAFNGALIGFSSRDAVCPDGPASFMKDPMAWWSFAQVQYDTPITLQYEDLDDQARYRVEIVYVATGWLGNQSAQVRLVAGNGLEIHDFLDVPTPPSSLKFEIPAAAISCGRLTLRWATK